RVVRQFARGHVHNELRELVRIARALRALRHARSIARLARAVASHARAKLRHYLPSSTTSKAGSPPTFLPERPGLDAAGFAELDPNGKDAGYHQPDQDRDDESEQEAQARTAV